MMISNDFKCKICNKVTRIKYEVASDSCSFHSYVPCKNCKTMLYGEYVQNDQDISAMIEYKNADRVQEKPDYVCTISRDFITEKVKAVQDVVDVVGMPMSLRFKNLLGNQEYFKIFSERVPSLLGVYNNTRHEWSNIMELWFNNELVYLDEQLIRLLDLAGNISDTERLSYIRKVGTMVFIPLYRDEVLNDTLNRERNALKEICEKRKKRLKDFLEEFDNNNELIELERIIYYQLRRTLAYIPNFIPIMSIDYLDEASKDVLFNEKFELGIYSFEFDEIKQLYQDLYETHVKVLHFFVGLDNLILRGDYNSFRKGSKYTNLNKYKKEFTAFKKIDEIDVGSLFCVEEKKYLDNHMRNMIGHCSYEYDSVTQLIKYKNGQNTLLEVAYYCYYLILGLCDDFQVITMLHEILLSGKLDT